MSEGADWVEAAGADAGVGLGLRGPLTFPPALVDLFVAGVDVTDLDERMLPPGPRPEFGVLGPDMGAFFDDYEFGEWMPGAWPIALDGAGGFFCLDLRVAIAARNVAEDAPVVWSHGGNLGWGPEEVVAVSDSVRELLAR